MIKKFLLLLSLITSLGLMATPFTVNVKGVVIDTTTGDAVPGATVQIVAKTFWGSLIHSHTTQTDRLGHFADSFYTDVPGFLRITASDSTFGTVDTLLTFSISQPLVSALIPVVRGADPCIASFTWQPDASEQGAINFANTSSGDYTRIIYDFGDGTSDTTQNPSHHFQPGSYEVCLTISNPTGCFDKRCEIIQIADPITCEVDFTYTQISGYQVVFQATTTSPYATEFTWFLEEGLQATGKNITHNFSGPGIYTIKIQAIDSEGCEDIHIGQVEVVETINPCQAAFRFIPDPQNPNLFHFTDASTGEIETWRWQLGDGSITTLQNPHHLYQTNGQYEVSLHVTNQTTGCNDSVTTTIDVGLGFYYTIAGQIFAGDFPADSAQVDVYRINNGLPVYAGSYTSGPYGIFHFYALTTGTYILKGGLKATSPEYGNYLTTYYSTEAFWENARRINLSADSTNIVFRLMPNPEMSNGIGTINGHIYYQLSGNMRSEIPAGYLPILLFDQGREPIHGVFSLEDGSFSFDEVPEGTWQLQPEITGMVIHPLELNISTNNQNQTNLVVTVEETGVSFGIGMAEPSDNYLSTTVFPNPAMDNWNISLSSESNTTLRITLISSDSRVVFEAQKPVSPGQNRLSFYTPELASGAYILIIKTLGNETITRKLLLK